MQDFRVGHGYDVHRLKEGLQRATMGSVISLFAGFLSVLVFMATGIIADYGSARIAVFLLIFMRIVVAFAYKRILSK